MDNRFYNFTDAVKAAEARLDDGQLLEDNAGNKYTCDNLMDYPDSRPDNGDTYWCVGYDGAIGYTENNGYNVCWCYTPTK